MKITNLENLKKFFKEIKTPTFGASVYAFARLGLEEFIDNYKLVSLYDSKETDLIAKDMPVFCLEKETGERLSPRNSSSLLCDEKTQNYLKKQSGNKKPLILVYKSSRRMKIAAKKNNFVIGIASYKFGKKLFENKAKFRKILKKIGANPTPGRVLPLSYLKYRRFSEMVDNFGKPFVMQHPQKGGGKGTFFVKNKEDFNRAKASLRWFMPKEIVVSKFIKGPSPSITGCVTRHGILSTCPQYQICDEHLLNKRQGRSGLFCGHDWSSSYFSQKVLDQAKEAVDRVGNYFKKSGYKGIFGLDFVLDEKEEELYIVECNPRLLASFPIITKVQLENGEPPIIAFHILEYLGENYKIDIKRINEQMWQKKKGSQMYFHNPYRKKVIIKKEIDPGIYTINNRGGIKFKKETYKFSDLKKNKEFLLTDGIPKIDTIINGYQRIRILNRGAVLGNDFRTVDLTTKKFLKAIKKTFKKNTAPVK